MPWSNPTKYPYGQVILNPYHELHDDINEAWWFDEGQCRGLKRGINGTATSGVSMGVEAFGPVSKAAANTDRYSLPGLGLGAWTELSIFTCFRSGASSSGSTWTDIFDISGTGENVVQLAYEFAGANFKFGFSLGTSDVPGAIASAFNTNYLLGISTKQSGNQITSVLNLNTGAYSSESITAHTTNSTGSTGNFVCGAGGALGFKGSMQFLVLFNRQLSIDELKMLVLGPRYALFGTKKLFRRTVPSAAVTTYGARREQFISMW